MRALMMRPAFSAMLLAVGWISARAMPRMSLIGKDQGRHETLHKDFPLLSRVMRDMCGMDQLELSDKSPCQRKTFGLSIAFIECKDRYDDIVKWEKCYSGCISPSFCQDTCLATPEENHAPCIAKCHRVLECIQIARETGEGTTSNEAHFRDCYLGEHNGMTAGPGPAAPAAAFLQLPAPAPAAPAPSAGGMASPAPLAPFIMQTTSAMPTGPCRCEFFGIVGDVKTNAPGCARHGKEPVASVDPYCYLQSGVNGGSCTGAEPSEAFPGLWFVSCETPSFTTVFEPSCELNNEFEVPIDVPEPMGILHPASSTDQMIAGYAMGPDPNEKFPVSDLNTEYGPWATPLPAEWNLKRGNYFGGTPPPGGQGPTVPPPPGLEGLPPPLPVDPNARPPAPAPAASPGPGAAPGPAAPSAAVPLSPAPAVVMAAAPAFPQVSLRRQGQGRRPSRFGPWKL
eukprot:gnl/TRDRNA2_/TRDRNA2_199136_c0_seq1.p1 gnl/TRDRNA2_/TRDRNA2_199136_c0~~gnl/TRDRNA2_/TRDRNA2_199136_c0_seq1.p1  ORF type:complete len:454 (-),score=81.07 gnl/TRDRNA2_/TRDRNA2_199136_c0_seq1:126-1487(-)